jgi:hypothetical protein
VLEVRLKPDPTGESRFRVPDPMIDQTIGPHHVLEKLREGPSTRFEEGK